MVWNLGLWIFLNYGMNIWKRILIGVSVCLFLVLLMYLYKIYWDVNDFKYKIKLSNKKKVW